MSQEDAPGVLQPGQVIRPVMDEENAKTLARKLFGLTVTSIKELNSYDDKNFHLQVSVVCVCHVFMCDTMLLGLN